MPIEFENEKDDNEWREPSIRYTDISTASKREGLRERKKKNDDGDQRKQDTSVTETWTPEEELQLWEIRKYVCHVYHMIFCNAITLESVPYSVTS